MVRAAEILDSFSARFGAPFLLGQRALVGSPLGVDGLAAIKHGLSVHTALADACARQVEHAGLFADLTPAPFDEDAGTLLYAGHELFACTHPQASAFYARAHTFARAATHEVNRLTRTLDPHRLLTRHLVVERILSATRTDVVVRWWTGSAAFYGEDAPRRLTAWPSVRRVDMDRSTAPMWKLALAAGDEELRLARSELLVALLDASPLTRMTLLGDPALKALGFSLALPYRVAGKSASPLDALEHRALARGVVDHLVERGIEASGAALALALLQGMRERLPPHALRRTAELCTHLALATCIIESDLPGAPEARSLRELLDDEPAHLNEALRVYWAVVASTLALDGAVFEVPAADQLPARVGALWTRLRERLRHARVVAVSEPLQRELRRHLTQNPGVQLPAARDTRTEG